MVDLKPAKPSVMIDKDEFERREAKKVEDDTKVRMFIITSNDGAARLIGLRGETIKQLRKEFADVNMWIGNKVPGMYEQVSKVEGPFEKVTELLMRIAKITMDPRSNDEPQLKLLVHNPGGLIGFEGQRVSKIRKESGAKINIAKHPLAKWSQTAVTVSGSLESLEKVTRMILGFISTCELLNIAYTPQMTLDRRERNCRCGVGRKDWTWGRHGCNHKDARSLSATQRQVGRTMGDIGRKYVPDILGRYEDWDPGYLDHGLGNPDIDVWQYRCAGYEDGYVLGWDSGALSAGKLCYEYDPFESSTSTKGFWTPSNRGWTVPGPQSGGCKSYSRNERGWATPGDVKQDWDLGTLPMSWRWQWLRRSSRGIKE